jgi:hypothetical protein
VQYREVRKLDRQVFAPVPALQPGWHVLAPTPTSGAIDYVRAPLLRGRGGRLAIVTSPLVSWVNAVLKLPRLGWVESTADNALDLLERRLTGSRRVYVFGAPYTTGLGVHDIHLNQGDPPGQFQHLDGIWRDGGTVIESAQGELGAFLTKFTTQSLHTDDHGLPA